MNEYQRKTKYYTFPLVNKNYINKNKSKYDIPFYIEGIPDNFSIFSTFEEAGKIRSYIKKMKYNMNNNNNDNLYDKITLDENPKADHTYCHLCLSRYTNYNEHINSNEHQDNIIKNKDLFIRIENNFKRINLFWKSNNNNSINFTYDDDIDIDDINNSDLIEDNCEQKFCTIKEIFSESTHPNSQNSLILMEQSVKVKKRKIIDINHPSNRRINMNLLPLTYHIRKNKKSQNH
jgi:hypothetical protein